MNVDEMQAGRDLDALIAERVMELPQCICEYRSGEARKKMEKKTE